MILGGMMSEIEFSDSRRKSQVIVVLLPRFTTQKPEILAAQQPFMNYSEVP